MKAYKGFDKDLKCRGFQYEVGKTYETDKAELCETGFHACEAPLDVFTYYPPTEGRYCEAELEDVSEERSGDSKRVGKKITIGAEIGIPGLVKAHVEWVKEQCDIERSNGGNGAKQVGGDWANQVGGDGANQVGGYRANQVGGYRANQVGGNGANQVGGDWTKQVGGDWTKQVGGDGANQVGGNGAKQVGGNGANQVGGNGAKQVGGDWTKQVGGKNAIMLAGNKSKFKAGLGSLVVHYVRNRDGAIKEFKAAIVDGETIKADTWYTLKDGEFVEAQE